MHRVLCLVLCRSSEKMTFFPYDHRHDQGRPDFLFAFLSSCEGILCLPSFISRFLIIALSLSCSLLPHSLPLIIMTRQQQQQQISADQCRKRKGEREKERAITGHMRNTSTGDGDGEERNVAWCPLAFIRHTHSQSERERERQRDCLPMTFCRRNPCLTLLTTFAAVLLSLFARVTRCITQVLRMCLSPFTVSLIIARRSFFLSFSLLASHPSDPLIH